MKFSVIDTSQASQTAWMTLAPGEASGPKENEHARSEQVLYLFEGELYAEVGERNFNDEGRRLGHRRQGGPAAPKTAGRARR